VIPRIKINRNYFISLPSFQLLKVAVSVTACQLAVARTFSIKKQPNLEEKRQRRRHWHEMKMGKSAKLK